MPTFSKISVIPIDSTLATKHRADGGGKEGSERVKKGEGGYCA